MDDDGQVRLLRARVASLEQLVTGLRDQLEKAVRAEVLSRAGSTGPMPPVSAPPPRKPARHKRNRDRDVTYLRVVKVATIGVLAAGVVAGAVIPASSIVATPVQAAPLPYALCDPPGFAPPSANGLWQLDMTPSGGPCIEIPTAVSGR